MDFFVDKVVLAPMVRANTIAMRIMCLNYGADIVFTPEIVDHSIIDCKKIENERLGTTDFINSKTEVIFRTSLAEKSRLIFQLGTSSSKRALRVLKLVENNVSGLDVNMGCPKHFSISGGMGAALLDNVEKAKKILSKLVNNSSIPITCKIRLLPGHIENTLNFIQEILPTKISAISIHGRTRFERSSDSCNIEYLQIICKSFSNIIPVIANGGSNDIACYQDILNFKKTCGSESVMVARAALRNPSIFKTDGALPIRKVLEDFIKLCTRYDIEYSQFKYMLNVMIPRSKSDSHLFTAETYNEIWYKW
ncbi:hypothetical protein MXB_1009 [Myxobolus squamalis]|nr:hypothetical protein MXB_1009 [Myxobolus squamalis]